MKILIIANNYFPYFDGISIFTNNLVNQLKKLEHNVYLLNFDKEFSKEKFALRDFFYTKATLNSYYSPLRIINPSYFSHPDRGFRNFIFTNMVYRISNNVINSYKPDIIHLIYPRLFSAIISTRIPIVSSVYSEEMKDTYPVKQMINKSKKIISISGYTSALVKTIDKNSAKKISVIPCSIEVKKYMSNHIQRKKYILSIGRLSKEKNFDTTIKAFSLLPDTIKKKYTYIIIGDGNERNILQKLINKLNLQSSVKLLGNLNEDKKIELLQESKYFILCPRIKKGEQEGFGIVYLEAQASGLPIITSQIGGIKEAVDKGGLYINNPEDPQEIANALLKIISNEKLANNLVNEGKKRINKFDHTNWINQVLIEYRKTLE